DYYRLTIIGGSDNDNTLNIGIRDLAGWRLDGEPNNKEGGNYERIFAVNVAPVVDPAGPFTAVVGHPFSFTVSASDPDLDLAGKIRDSVTLVPTNALNGMTCTQFPTAGNPVESRCVWTPSASLAGTTVVVKFEATDAPGMKDSRPVSIKVIANSPPTIVFDPSDELEVIVGQLLTFTTTATDPDGDPVTVTQNPPSGMTCTSVAQDVLFDTNLDSAQEVQEPAVASSASGTATLRFNPVTYQFDLDVFVKGIAQSELTASHLHGAPAGLNDPNTTEIFSIGDGSLYTPVSGGLRRVISGQVFPTDPTDSAKNVLQLLGGHIYINVHTTNHAAGEIRGQLPVRSAGSVQTQCSWTPRDQDVSPPNTPTVIKFEGTDPLGAKGTGKVIITVEPNNPPVVSQCPSDPLAVVAGHQLKFTVCGSDPDRKADGTPRDTVTLQALNAPLGMKCTQAPPDGGNPVELRCDWTPTIQQVGTFVVTFQASDGGKTGTGDVTITVSPDNPPKVSVPDPTVVAGHPLAFTVTALDPEGDISTLGPVNAPPDMTCQQVPRAGGNPVESRCVWTPGLQQLGKFAITFQATDSLGVSSPGDLVRITVNPNQPPLVTFDPANRSNIVAGQSVSFTAIATDPEGDPAKVQPLNGPTGIPMGMSCAASVSEDVVFTASLSSSQEVQEPAVSSNAGGTVTVRFNPSTGLFDLDLFVKGIAQSDLVASHLHTAPAGMNGPVIFSIGDGAAYTPETGGLRMLIKGASFQVPDVDVAAKVIDLLAGHVYVKVHTTAFSAGEIRGQLPAHAAGPAQSLCSWTPTAQQGDRTYTIDFQGTDSLGASSTAPFTVKVFPFCPPELSACLQPDPGDPSGIALVVNGTIGSDNIEVIQKPDRNIIEVTFLKRRPPFLATFPDDIVGRIIVHADGLAKPPEGQRPPTNFVHIGSSDRNRVTKATMLFGGPGKDHLHVDGGDRPNVLVGGAGDDHLETGTNRLLGDLGRDVLIGGTGRDRLKASAGDNILISGYTDFDAKEAELAAIVAEWARTGQDPVAQKDYQTRVDHLLTGGGLNGLTLLNRNTVHDDGVVDVLDGFVPSSRQKDQRDWFLANVDGDGDRKKKDSVGGVGPGEVVTDINIR
ncbi:MAG: CHRD domain-containing protein, partial [Planctomycetes bacterium]|nr:CHRD domain-containing protein [Planctomycetota bacterium]